MLNFNVAQASNLVYNNEFKNCQLEKLGYKTRVWQGKPESNWLILDLGSIIVHVMGAEERKRYSLEELWEKTSITYHL